MQTFTVQLPSCLPFYFPASKYFVSKNRVRWHQPRNSDLYDSGWSNFELTGPLASQQKHVKQCHRRWFQKSQRGQSWQQYSRVKIGGLPPPKNVGHRWVMIDIKPIARRKASLLTFLYPCISMISCSCSSSQPLILEVLLAGLLFLGGLVSSGLEWKGQKGWDPLKKYLSETAFLNFR